MGRDMGAYRKLGLRLGQLVDDKAAAYGDSVGSTQAIMAVLYPGGIPAGGQGDALLVARVLDKLKRVATAAGQHDPMGESPWMDVAGYGLLGWHRDTQRRQAAVPWWKRLLGGRQ